MFMDKTATLRNDLEFINDFLELCEEDPEFAESVGKFIPVMVARREFLIFRILIEG
jgi:hypothetical protein